MTPQQVQDEALFWLGSQDREHMLFLKLGMDPAASNGMQAEASRLHAAYEDANRRRDISALLALSTPSQALKRTAYDASRQKWIGWLFPLFYDHTRREIDYALTRIHRGSQRPLSPQEEICFWTQIGAEHAAMTAQLLDPTEKLAMQLAMREYTKMDQLHTSCAGQIMPSLLALTTRSAKELDSFFTTAEKAKLKSVIHPVLVAHIVREGRRFVQTMQALSNGPPRVTTAGLWR